MALKTFVKVGNITNLSDARYCAGMGVDMLGFDVESKISPEKYAEMVGWLSGIRLVAEFEQSSLQEINQILQKYPVDAIQVQKEDILEELYQKTKDSEQSLIHIIFSSDSIELLLYIAEKYTFIISFLLLKEAEKKSQKDIENLAKKVPLLLQGNYTVTDIQNLLEHTSISGIALEGSAEIAPGLKDFDELAEILEALEID
ncbi:MAG: phosphoribosylanthranilate isomerase [Thermonemataceae bacterium]|nr:phosphoribosylanthranilate isomerase [Thermonemataceae bacterium]